MKKIIFAALLSISLTSACFAQKDNPTSNLANNSPQLKMEDTPDENLRNQIEKIASAAKGRVGVGAVVLETGNSVSLNQNERFPMQSVYKLPIAMAVLKQVDAGKIKLDQTVRVEKSDFVSIGQHSPIRDKYPSGTSANIS